MENLERSLNEAFANDAKRKAEDDMKKRAIVTARSYEEFRHLVAAAQQKPIEKNDFARKVEVSANRSFGMAHTEAPSVGFDLGTAGQREGPSSIGPKLSISLGASPTNISQFDRAWRRLPSDVVIRAKFLAQLGPARLRLMFVRDIDGDVLSTLLQALAGGGSQTEAGTEVSEQSAGSGGAARLALALTSSEGFPFALELLSEKDIDAARRIRDAANTAGACEEAAQLTSAFRFG